MSVPGATPSPSRTTSLNSALAATSRPSQGLLPRPPQTTSATYSPGCKPNTLIIQLSTSVVIPDYNLFYAQAPISSFLPAYASHADGSLIAPPFLQDLTEANISLLVIGALAIVFLRNIIVSGDYLRRGKVQKKRLFYALFLSQLLAFGAFIPLIFSYFSDKGSCTLIIQFACLCSMTSLAILITVILGVKVYKCMGGPKFIPIVLFLVQAASTSVMILDIALTDGKRRLTGSCTRTNDLRFVRFFVVIQFVESLFICCCFIYICWKSRANPAARGRISVQLSMYDRPIAFPEDQTSATHPMKRGWWDYAPDEKNALPSGGTGQLSDNGTKPFFGNLLRSIKPGNGPTQQANQKSAKLRKGNLEPEKDGGAGDVEDTASGHSSTSKFSRLIPRMELFHDVMKDELFYTTFITASCVIVAVLSAIGVNFKNGLSVAGWIVLNWGIISLLSVQSFGHVVRRHERDALLSHPVTSTAIMRAANDIAKRPHLRSSLQSNSKDPFADPIPRLNLNPFNPSLDGLHSSTSSIVFHEEGPDDDDDHATIQYAKRSNLRLIPITSNLHASGPINPVARPVPVEADQLERNIGNWLLSSAASVSSLSSANSRRRLRD